MNILFLSTTFPDASSPARGTYNAALCRALARRHRVHVIAPRLFTEVHRSLVSRREYSLPHDLQQAGLTADYPTVWYTPRWMLHRFGGQMWWSVRWCVQAALRRFQPDVVLSYWAHPEGEVGLRAGRMAGIPSAVIVGGTDVLILPSVPRRRERIRRVLTESHAVITVSEGLRTAVWKLGVPADQIRTIYQGIDDEVFHPRPSRAESQRVLGLADDSAHLLWVGRMASIKALHVLIDAAAILNRRGTRFQLHLLGDGPLRSAWQQLSAQLGLDHCIHFHGTVGPDRIADWYRAVDLTVLCSDSEGLPNVLRESLACGTPFVSTDVGSVREIAQPGSLLLVPPRDPAALAAGIVTMLHPEARECAAYYQPRTWSECARETIELLESLLPGDRKVESNHAARSGTATVTTHPQPLVPRC